MFAAVGTGSQPRTAYEEILQMTLILVMVIFFFYLFTFSRELCIVVQGATRCVNKKRNRLSHRIQMDLESLRYLCMWRQYPEPMH